MSISQGTPDSGWFSTPEGAAWLTTSRANPAMSFDAFHSAWLQAHPSSGMTTMGAPLSDPSAAPSAAPASGYPPQPGRDLPGTGTYGQTGGAYDFSSLLHPAVPVAPAPAGTTPAVGVNPPSDQDSRSGGDSGPGGTNNGGGTGGTSSSSGSSSGSRGGIGGSGFGLGGALGAIGGITGGALGAVAGRAVAAGLNAVNDMIDPPTMENSLGPTGNMTAADMSREASKEAAAANAEASQGGGPVGPNGSPTGSEAQGSEGGRNAGGAGAGTGGPGTGADGTGGHGTDAGGNDASDGPGGGAGAWSRGGIVGNSLSPAKGGHRPGQVSGRSFNNVGPGIRAYGMGFANGGATKLLPQDEEPFQSWYAGMARDNHIDPNVDAPEHHYDMRGAYASGHRGAVSAEDNRLHFPSEFKTSDHPNRFIDTGNGTLDSKYGQQQGYASGGFATANTHGVGAGRSVPHGLVPGASPGRADALHASVKRGSYIMPADVVSAIGGGNTANGGAKLNNWVGGAGFKSGAGMPGTGYARGGLVDVRLSSGEYHVPPEFVHWLGKGDPERGAKILDGHVARIRAKQITHLRNLPPPK